MTYAGLEGWNTALKHVIWQNNLGHAICDHLRNGDWAFDYVVNRLDKYAAKLENLSKFKIGYALDLMLLKRAKRHISYDHIILLLLWVLLMKQPDLEFLDK